MPISFSMTRLLAFASAIALASAADPAAAQGRLGLRLDDPTGAYLPEPPLPEAPPGGDVLEADIPGAEVRDRLRALDATFAALAASGGPNWTGVVLSLIGGGVEIGFGIAFATMGEPWSDLAPYFVVLGGTSIARTIVADLILRPDPTGPAIQYANMPSATLAQQRARLAYGETQLFSIAESAMIARIVDASLNIAGALAVIPAYLVPKDFMIENPLEAFIFIAPAISLVLAIITLASPTQAEQRRDAYARLRDQLRNRRGGAHLEVEAQRPAVTLGFGASVDPRGGGVVMLGGMF
jgi:hypothetical protein